MVLAVSLSTDDGREFYREATVYENDILVAETLWTGSAVGPSGTHPAVVTRAAMDADDAVWVTCSECGQQLVAGGVVDPNDDSAPDLAPFATESAAIEAFLASGWTCARDEVQPCRGEVRCTGCQQQTP